MRSRHRRTLVPASAALAAALVLAACGGSSNSSDHTGGTVTTVTETVTQPANSTTGTGPQTDTTATKTTTTPAAIGNACNASDLTPRYLGSNGAAGTIVLGFALENSGSTTCHTYGWPGVQFLAAGGTALRTNATRTSGDVLGSTPAAVLTLKPGEEASFRIVASDMATGGGSCPTAHALQIYAPDDTTTLKVGVPGVAACGKATLSPMMPGASAFAAGGSGGGGGGGQTGIGSGASGGSGGSGGSGQGGSGGQGGPGGSGGSGGQGTSTNGGSGLSSSSE